MRAVFEKKYNLRAGDFDKFGRIKPSALLELFEDAAGQHAEELGVGFESMMARSYLWVLTRTKLKIMTPPKKYMSVTVKTWPLEANRLNYRREYCICDEQDNVMVAASSDWMVIDSTSRKLVSAADLYPAELNLSDRKMFEERLGKVHDFDVCGEGYRIRTGFCELDVNNHINNTKYANYVLDAISPAAEDEIETFQLDYRKEVVQGADLKIFFSRQEDAILAKGENLSGDIMFACRIELKKEKKEI